MPKVTLRYLIANSPRDTKPVIAVTSVSLIGALTDSKSLAMSRFLPLFSQVVILFLSARASSEVKEPTCQDNGNVTTLQRFGYNVCHYKGVLVEVTQSRFEDQLSLLDLCDLDLLEIRENAFKNVSTDTLHLDLGNRISVLKRESFRGLPNLKVLYLDSNVVPLSGHLFADLRHLQLLSLMFNKIDSIPKDSFAGLSSLIWLYLGYNDIEAIEAESFSNLNPGVESLYLDKNKISRVAPDSFAGLTELNYLYLDYNQLEDLPSGAFRGLNKLKKLYLNDNRITSVSRSLLRDLVGLERLYLQQNEISALEPDTFRDLSQLKHLNLSGNKLSHIVVGTFAGLSNLEDITLSDNGIHTVDNGTFADLVKLRYLYFGGNNFEIDKEVSGLPHVTVITKL
ncbi:uncharacterized protein [Temnothorax nylanderi]|uniref:uncharacterized protein n=1 Tax=Temnothorax nylanderi TaxID=102681 RepID=UPI003A8A165B